MMVLAGPGAGKTFVITNRVCHLITEHQVPPEEILVVTFSRAAAEEMKERFEIMTGERPAVSSTNATKNTSHVATSGYQWASHRFPVRFGTFHSVFFEILKRAYHYEAKDIVTDSLKYRLIDEAIRETGYEVEDEQEFLEDLEKEISRVKGDGIDIETYYSANCPEEVFRDIFKGYQDRLLKHRALDFDDMVGYTHDLLVKRKDILALLQKKYRYILIDEFQDINRLQYENIRMLAEPENNIFIVGDDDQSIYGFRGARPDIMLSFPKQYPGAETVTLALNYRCSEPILVAAGRLIGNNRRRYGKNIRAVDEETTEPVHIVRKQDLPSEAEYICEEIDMLQSEGVPISRIAVLFRTNMQMRILAGKLMDRSIPFRMKEALPNMFRTFVAKDIIAYLHMAAGDDSRETFLQIMNRPVRYISRKALTDPEVDFRKIRNYYMKEKQYWMLDRLSEFEEDITHLRKMTPITAIHYIRKQIGYEDFLKERALERGVKPDDWFETLEEITDSASGMTTIREWLEFVENYGEELKRMREENPADRPEGVELMTMHAAKGLEFDAVFIPTLNEGVSPYRKATLPAEIEEERRMLYVAMTRTRRFLYISYVSRRYNKQSEPSRFLEEIGVEAHGEFEK
ncbi:MAG: ATP-dependent helicase [Eubacterium sp.]|nr:ATP-dependent helicase [Eubacterium sp.]